jgi:hypothetical protein
VTTHVPLCSASTTFLRLLEQDEDYVVDEAVEGADDDEEGDASSSEEDNEEEEGSEDAPQDSCERPGPTDAAVGDSVSAAPSAVQHSVAGGSTVPAEEEIRRRLQGGCRANWDRRLGGYGLKQLSPVPTLSSACSVLLHMLTSPRQSLHPMCAELGASLGGDDDPVFEEEILSDSDISQHFSEEEEEEEAAALLGDSSGPSLNLILPRFACCALLGQSRAECCAGWVGIS